MLRLLFYRILLMNIFNILFSEGFDFVVFVGGNRLITITSTLFGENNRYAMFCLMVCSILGGNLHYYIKFYRCNSYKRFSKAVEMRVGKGYSDIDEYIIGKCIANGCMISENITCK